MRKKHRCLVALCLLLITPTSVFAWNAAGHMLVALIAYEKMTPQQRETLVAILKKHPRFKEDFLDRMPPAVRREPSAVQDEWIFLNASTWPDIARGFKNDLRKKYHHGPWHYINVPIFLTDADRTALQGRLTNPLGREWSQAHCPNPQNIAQAYRKCMHDLTSPDTSGGEKAVALCWVLHLVGDVHQPLHTVALFSQRQFPEGDRGGNALILQGDRSLHSYWDGLMGDDTSLSTLNKLHADLKKSMDLQSVRAVAAGSAFFDQWIDESVSLAQKHVYTAEMRNAAKEAGDLANPLYVGALTEQYQTASLRMAQRRIVEAGFRTAKVLECIH